ncbi:cytochrome P450 734A1 [Cryptomeria japonica]|uniref:cytochrome P450 734A1 n=1 Tax=Cryptomeria japonica TaxID=3369 RepID=UPI0027D9DD45|nr:cytochrome P450 734A1 [Cryptomeria japonica]
MGSTFLLWFAPVAGTNIADPQLVQEILSLRSDDYEKIEANNALKKLEGEELLDLKGEKYGLSTEESLILLFTWKISK